MRYAVLRSNSRLKVSVDDGGVLREVLHDTRGAAQTRSKARHGCTSMDTDRFSHPCSSVSIRGDFSEESFLAPVVTSSNDENSFVYFVCFAGDFLPESGS